MKIKLLFVVSLFFISIELTAQTDNLWKGNFSLGGSYYSGNVNKMDLRSEGLVSHTDSTFEFSAGYKTVYGRVDDDETNREFKTSVKCDWKPYSIVSPFLLFETYNNIYKGYDLKISAITGAKFMLLKKSKFNLSLSFAGLYSFEDYAEPLDSTEIEKPDAEIFRLSLRPKIKWKFADNVYFEHVTFYQPNVTDFNDYIIETKTTLTNKLNNILFLDLSLEYDFVNKPPSADIKKKDLAFIVSLRVKF